MTSELLSNLVHQLFSKNMNIELTVRKNETSSCSDPASPSAITAAQRNPQTELLIVSSSFFCFKFHFHFTLLFWSPFSFFLFEVVCNFYISLQSQRNTYTIISFDLHIVFPIFLFSKNFCNKFFSLFINCKMCVTVAWHYTFKFFLRGHSYYFYVLAATL